MSEQNGVTWNEEQNPYGYDQKYDEYVLLHFGVKPWKQQLYSELIYSKEIR